MYIYITLAFLRANDRASGVTVGDGQQYYREVEGYDLTATKELPKTPYLELARVYCSDAGQGRQRRRQSVRTGQR